MNSSHSTLPSWLPSLKKPNARSSFLSAHHRVAFGYRRYTFKTSPRAAGWKSCCQQQWHTSTITHVHVKAKLSCAGYLVFLKDNQKLLTAAKTSLTTSQSVCKAHFNLALFSFYHKNTAVDCFETETIQKGTNNSKHICTPGKKLRD